jgi:uncharacterized membrane protein YkvA (DUF1232 family)
MTDLFAFLRIAVIAGCALFVVGLVLLALPQSKLRTVATETMKYVAAVFLVLLAISPIDILPDVIPVLGWADDVGYLGGAWLAVVSALGDRKQRRFMQECDNARMASEAGLTPTEDEQEEVQA